MDRKGMKYKSIAIVLIISCLSITTAKVINTNTKLPLEVKTLPNNASNTELLTSTNILSKLSSNEIDPNVHPIESTSPALADEPEAPLITNEVIPGNPAGGSNPEVSPDVNPDPTATNPVNTDDPNPLNKFCKCSEYACDCCRSFAIPILPVRAPTCARIRYLGNEKMSIQLKYGDVVLVTRQVSGSKSPPICIPMPGGFNQFCGRVYGLAKGPNDFKACLGFELRADDDVEASLRVSCFRFGAQGFSVAEAEPLPSENEKEEEDDDDDDLFGLADDDDDEEEEEESADDDDGGLFGDYADDDDDAEYPSEQEDAEPDYGGFSVLDGIFSDGESKKLKDNVTQIKTVKTEEKAEISTVEVKNTTKLEASSTKDMKSEGENEEVSNKDQIKQTNDENEDDDEADEDDDEEDEEEDDEEDTATDATDKTEANNKIKKEKPSTFEYFLDFVSKLVKLF